MSSTRPRDRHLYRRLFEQCRPYTWYLLVVLFLSMLGAPLSVLTPLPLKIAVDHVVGSADLPGWTHWLPDSWTGSKTAVLVFAVALLIGVALVQRLRELLQMVFKTYAGERLVLDFR